MPHIIVEYSANLADHLDVGRLVNTRIRVQSTAVSRNSSVSRARRARISLRRGAVGRA
jgi:5-carboxymethyl-2-hydroxymuconate isomerase